jgi:hypothetical protein
MTLPRHPGDNEDAPTDKTQSRGTQLIIALVALLIIVVVVLHLTGVIGGH